MILNTCVKNNTSVDENVCKFCKDKSCRHAGEPTTKERLEGNFYGKNRKQKL